jgi:hypothetical protein
MENLPLRGINKYSPAHGDHMARIRANTNHRKTESPYDTEAIAVGRSKCARGAQKVMVCWAGVDRRG